MDEKILNQYAFEIFSRVKILEIEFKVFKAEQRLKEIQSEGPNATLQKMNIEDKEFPRRILLVQSEIGGYKLDLEKLKTQIEEFKKEKGIAN